MDEEQKNNNNLEENPNEGTEDNLENEVDENPENLKNPSNGLNGVIDSDDMDILDSTIPVAENFVSGSVVGRLIEDEMKKSYLDYAMSVIVGRALPDVRDGLKPVHRRILYAMNELGMTHNKAFKKSARIVGEVLGKYHPHGDTAVYDSMVRMVQEFSLRYPLVKGQGNFGSIDGDSAAAMRYTEAKLAKISNELLGDIEKDTIDFIDNFDGSLKEPVVLPAKIPNLLINGSSGIAVGMATNIPPHNLTEVGQGIVYLIDNPDAQFTDLMKFVKGPDFPTGASIIGKQGIYNAYKSGRGKLIIRSIADIQEKGNRHRIIITEIPYQVNKASLIEDMAHKANEKRIEGISGLRDESGKEGIRIVVELKKDANPNVVLNQMYKYTRLEDSFGIILLGLIEGAPKVFTLKEIMQCYIDHRIVVVTRRTQFELTKSKDRMHILEGLIIALNNVDEVIQKIKKSKDANIAQTTLIDDYNLTEKQAKAILEMRLQRIAALEQEKIRTEHKELSVKIKWLQNILNSDEKIKTIIKTELIKVVDTYGDERKTKIEEGEMVMIEDVDLIKKEDMVITISETGYVKRQPVSVYKQQNRGGKGVIGADLKEEDSIKDLFIASTHDYLLLFTSKGIVHWIKVYEIPIAGRTARGKAIINFVPLTNDEKIMAIVPVREFKDTNYLVLATRNGTIKKTALSQYSKPRKGGIRAIILDEKDNLIEAKITNGQNEIMLATMKGQAVRFNEKDARPIGRTAKGVRGILLKGDDKVIGMIIVNDEKNNILTVTENGYGKRSPIQDYRLINRGGSGVRNIFCSERNGKVVSVSEVTDEDELMLVSNLGIIIRIPIKTISVIGRNTQGVRIMRLKNNSGKVVAARKIVVDDVEQAKTEKIEIEEEEVKQKE